MAMAVSISIGSRSTQHYYLSNNDDCALNSSFLAEISVARVIVLARRHIIKHKDKARIDTNRRPRQVHHNNNMNHPTIQNDNANQNDHLHGMRQWINNLSFQSLLDALEFTFQSDASSASSCDSCPPRRRRRPRPREKQQEQQCHSHGNHRSLLHNFGDSGSHEFGLLMTMVSHQYPDRDSNAHNFHGIDEVESGWYEWRRHTKASQECPTLFRWVNSEAMEESVSYKKTANPLDKSVGNPSTSSSVGAGSSSSIMPAELLDLLAQAGVKRSTASLLQTFNEVDEIDKAFESLGDCRDNMAKSMNASEDPPTFTSFTVEAYQAKFDDGTCLGRGTTIDQQRADTSILHWTALIMDKSIDTGEDGLSLRCTLCTGDISTKHERLKKKMILDTLRIVSRGKFLSLSGERKNQSFAPWFDPTQQWFTLPMYLSSRFEASLWDAYDVHRGTMASGMDGSEDKSLLQSMKTLSEDAIGRVLCYAINAVVRDEMKQDACISNSQTEISNSIHASLIYQLLFWSDQSSMLAKMHRASKEFASIPLLEWNTPRIRLKSLVMEFVQEGLAREAERSLIQSLASVEVDTKPTAFKKKKRAKKKRSTANQSTKSGTNKVDQSDDDEISDDEDEPHVELILHTSMPPVPHSDSSEGNRMNYLLQNEKNDTKMIVLSILNDVIYNAFAKLGVEDDDFNEFKDAVPAKYRTSEREPHCPSIDKSRSADDIEVATTALVSNRIGARVDAAMTFLQRASSDSNNFQSQIRSRQLWASRSTRQTGSSPQRRRSASIGAASSDKKPPMYPSKMNQPTNMSSDDALWPSSDSLLIPQASRTETSIFDGAPLCLSGALDGWNSVACQRQSETSIFTELLNNDQATTNPDCQQRNIASSTAASIASSSAVSMASSREYMEDSGLDCIGDFLAPQFVECDGDRPPIGAIKSFNFKSMEMRTGTCDLSMDLPNQLAFDSTDEMNGDTLSKDGVDYLSTNVISESNRDMEMSPTPFAPPTPPPQLSPILVSLADLGKLRVELLEQSDLQSSVIPKPSVQGHLTAQSLKPSLSRDDLRSIDECRKPSRRERDDHHNIGHRQIDALLSYRNVVAKPAHRKPPSLKSFDGKQKHRDDSHPILTRSTRSIKTTRSGARSIHTTLYGPEPILQTSEPILNRVLHLAVACAKSESGLDGDDGASHCNVMPSAHTEDTMTKDGTTISSVHSPPATEELATLKEERNLYRDMCLTLGAENAKLMNLLASKTCTPLYRPTLFAQEAVPSFFYSEQHWPAPNSFPNQFSTQSIVAMSDAGIHRAYSAMSEDGTDIHPSVVAIVENQNTSSWQARGDSVHSVGYRTSGCGTYADSDTSFERNLGQESIAFNRVHHHDAFFGPIPLHGIKSRLSEDITRYMNSLQSQLKKAEGRRIRAVEGITKTALWPRAQIKMYGSHVTNLCLPSSDMDFVICLPAVHKNAPATAPGDLEGRNAINETNQKVLARKLKTESWLDQRSIKVIERTAVPVIKVSTKDVRSRVVQLDLSFDAKEHHGLEALAMIQHILEEMPMVRPLVLVLKQFLLDRGLLTAYTGGLSSYCLFLMVARYCQEQVPIWNDCGSLLMGLLDFYGNCFDPRTTGMSVRTRQYFFRSQDAHDSLQNCDVQGWNIPHQSQFPDMMMRNSASKQNRLQPLHRQFGFQSTPTNISHKQQFPSGKFDPIWVEDPLNPLNNVGRNAFRIFQVQRAFSDAHRALVASLEWDINSTNEFDDDGEYPLLKCLLQNEDVFFSIEDNPINR
ncbi:hypothetical protein ACHAXH_009948 [Discostella pseudostelligera]